jgi:cytochrome c553
MNKKLALAAVRPLISAVGVFFAMHAMADGLIDGSAEAGKDKSITCSACHGADGNSVNPAWPSIAGQHAQYIAESLQTFKDGSRSDVLMSGQSMMLQDQDMRDLGAYFSSQTAAVKAVADPSLVDKGQSIYRGGDRESSTSACMACHGPGGRGNPAASYPSLRGQYAVYTAKQLRDYASDTRKSDGPTKVMRDIAKTLDEEDIVAVSSYIQGLK